MSAQPHETLVELKPCPRCGSRAFVGVDKSVLCTTDRCLRLPPRPTEAEAREAWNTRTPSPSIELVEALEPFGTLEISPNAEGNAGIYGIAYSDIERARATLSKAKAIRGEEK